MLQYPRLSAQATASFDGQTEAPKRCKVELVAGSGGCYTDEITGLLRRRLRLAALIALGGFLFFLARKLIFPADDPFEGWILGFHTAVVLALSAVSAVLWSGRCLSRRALRFIEIGCFGLMACFFTALQIQLMNKDVVLTWSSPEHEPDVLRAAATASNLRWFMLIVLYGTFIPNTWRRCALVVGAMAAVPIGLTLLVSNMCPYMGPHLGPANFDVFAVMGMAVAIAIFGSYRISELQQEAFEAKKLGQYQLKKRLGAGGMGEVYLGEHVLLRRACAIKLIRPDQAGDPTHLQRFEREVQAMATLTHWNTVEIYDYGITDDGTFYYVMEYLPGLSLQDLVDRHGPLPPARAVHFLRQVCAALFEAHSVGLIHRDIKPSNVIACQRGGVHDVAKLLDFGLVQSIGLKDGPDKLTIQGTILGSPPFMAPEQALGKSNLDARTDIYSVGALAYFLLTAQPPFVKETPMEMLFAHAHDAVVPPVELRPEISADLQEVVLQCLEKDPSRRFADARHLDQALAQCEGAGEWDRERAAQWWDNADATTSRHAVA